MYKKTVLTGVILVVSFIVKAQINEYYPNLYNYLYRMANKGFITFDDEYLPTNRLSYKEALDSLTIKKGLLSTIEKEELAFFMQEFYNESTVVFLKQSELFFKRDTSGRFRTFSYQKGSNFLNVDPLIGFSLSSQKYGSTVSTFGGIRVYGQLNKHLGINIAIRDITERGDSLDYRRNFSPEQGILNTSNNPKQLNYSRLNFNLGYKFKNGYILIAKDDLYYGYGFGGRIILSNKVPSFPFVKLNYNISSRLRFNYIHAWLNSNIIDSTRSYNTGTNVLQSRRDIYINKFLAMHSLTYTINRGLDVSLGESVIYSDKLNFGYLIPINIFKLYDQYESQYNLNAGSNTQFFLQLSSRNQIKNTHLYGSIFIDELKMSTIFSKTKNRNQFAFTVGINKTDFFFKYLTIGAEYTRINPFVYNNILPAQTYKSSDYLLGDWMGQNADRLHLFCNYTPIARLKLLLTAQFIRKGAEGTLDQQYVQQETPPFLFGNNFNYFNVAFNTQYEFINRLNCLLKVELSKQTYLGNKTNNSIIYCGFNYGL